MSGLRFRRIAVRRMPGIEDPFELRDLAPGINLVHGPNASGKTTTARALEALIWPRTAERSSTALDASAELGADQWSIRLDAGLVEYQNNGVPATALPTAPAENRDRYRLWLPDLLRSDDTDFARRILIESSGGFDLDEAARVLDRRRFANRQRQQQQEYRRAKERVREARATQEALVAERAELAAREARLAEAGAVEEEARLLSLALDHARARDEAAAARRRLDGFSPIVARLRGDEADQLSTIRARLDECAGHLAAAEALAASAERELRRLSLPTNLVEGDVLYRLTADVDRLNELDRIISDQQKASDTAAYRLAEEGKPLAGVADPARLAAVDLEALDDLSRAVSAFESAREQQRALSAELAALPEESGDGDLNRLREGALLLRQWLIADTDESGEAAYLRRLAGAGIVLAFAFAVVLLAIGRVGLGAVALGAAGLMLMAFQRAPRPVDVRPGKEREYLRLGLLDAPDLWDPKTVGECLTRLEGKIDRIERAQRSRQRRQQLQTRLAEVERDVPAMGDRVRQLAEEFGLSLPMDGVRLLWLVERISRWQKARAERVAAERALVVVCAEQRALLDEANQRLESIGLEPVMEGRSLRGTVERLRQDLASYERASGSLREATEKADRERKEIERLEAEAAEILERAGLTPEEEHTLPDHCARVDEYRRCLRDFEIADGQRAQHEQRLHAWPMLDESLLELPAAVLEARLADTQRRLSELQALREEIGSLRERIAAATSGHVLEDALAEEARCRDALRELRSRELRNAVADLLVEYVQRETRSEHLPEVFHRANQLFNRVTRGAYELRVDATDTPSFRAYDTRLERGLSLDQLSSGTRVQLLLSVRVAFVERLEAGIALPLMMDETLANSDDERASAIMDAVIELAADGRQVFYFTAQPDEIVKWTRALAARPEVPYATIDLAEVRNLENRLDFDLVEIAEAASGVPSPGRMDHREYGRALRVPRIDIHAPISTVHLWYLVEELDLLHHILANLGASSWGELRSLMETNGPILLDAPSFARIRAAAALAESAIERIRIGRGRTVDRRALVASGVVSDRFIDEVDALCRRVEGNARRLIEELENRAVAKFQTRNIEAMRDYFEREGFLDGRDPIGIEIIRRQSVAEQSGDASGPLSLAEVDRLVARVAAGAGFPVYARRTPSSPQPQLWPEISM